MQSRVIATGAVVLALLSGGAAIYVFSTGKGLSDYIVEDGKPDVIIQETPPQVTYVKLDPLQVVLRGGNQRTFQVLLTLSLELGAPTKVAVVQAMMPRLRDAFIRELYAQPLNAQGRWSASDIEIVKHRLVSQSRKVLGDGVVTNVLIQQAIPIGQ